MRKLLALAAVALAAAVAPDAAADVPWVDRPLTLPPLHVSADAGIGFGLFEGYRLDPGGSGNVTATGSQAGWGANLEAAVGLPFIGELGLRFGYRFGPDITLPGTAVEPSGTMERAGAAAGTGLGADHFARLFDPIVTEPGQDDFTNPELRVRNTLLDLKVLELGLETRVILPTATGSDLAVTPALPVRVHVPGLLRVDTGVFVPVVFDSVTSFAVDIPAQAFFQVHDAFVGPLTGIRFVRPGGDAPSYTEIPLGIGAGYTLGGIIDLKVQVRTERVNDPAWWEYFGAGVGVGLRVP